MGMTVFSGMLVATVVGVLLVPAMFVAVERFFGGSKTTPATGQGVDSASEAGDKGGV